MCSLARRELETFSYRPNGFPLVALPLVIGVVRDIFRPLQVAYLEDVASGVSVMHLCSFA